LLRKGYWAFAYIPVSTRIKKSPKQYSWAYLYSEQDDNDLTYFIDYNLRQIELARRDFENYVQEKTDETEAVDRLAKTFSYLNDRQLQLVHYLQNNPKERTNVTSLVRIHGITAATAVKDLKTMTQAGLLTKERKGRNIFYYPTENIFAKK
jgi:Fic family protein